MSQQRVLIVTYYWPPAGGPGVQRWLKFAKYLPKNGIIPIVYCPENPNYPIKDPTLINDIPGSVEVIKSKISEPYRFSKMLSSKKTSSISSGMIPKLEDQSFIERLLLFIRGNLFIPDARKSWVKPSVKYLSEIIISRNLKCVVTTGPPHSLHLIGLKLKKELHINWVADFRDPWTTIGYHKSLKLLNSSSRKHEELEKRVLTEADALIVTSGHTKKEFLSKTNKPVTVITNGFDGSDIIKPSLDERFSLSHIGSLLADRNPQVLWDTLAELVIENSEFAEQFQLNLVGVVSKEVIEEIKRAGLGPYTKQVGYVSHEMALEFQTSSQLLLLIEIDSVDTKAIIPGKIFEYLQSGRPILGIGPENSGIEEIIRETNTGKYFNYNEKSNLKNYLLDAFYKFTNGKLECNPTNIEKYSRRQLTEKLAQLLQKYL